MTPVPAEVGRFFHAGRELTDIKISETGLFRVDASSLPGKPDFFSRALDVVRLSVGRERGTWVLEPQGVVTTEFLADGVRLVVSPKVPFDALWLLIQLAGEGTKSLPNHAPIDFAPHASVYDLFAQQFIESVGSILQYGWVPSSAAREIVSQSITGQVDPHRSALRLWAQLDLRFDQRTSRLTFDNTANRVIKAALAVVAHADFQLSPEYFAEARRLLAGVPDCRDFTNHPEAVSACRDLLRYRPLDPSRGYYYPALQAALPLLDAWSPQPGGGERRTDVPLRLSLDKVFEAATRNVCRAGLRENYRVDAADEDQCLYTNPDPPRFNVRLKPDILIRDGSTGRVIGVIDVKYKERPTGPDHYQLLAYLARYSASFGGFVTVGEDRAEGGHMSSATTDGKRIVEYAIDPTRLAVSFGQFARWLEQQLEDVTLSSRRRRRNSRP